MNPIALRPVACSTTASKRWRMTSWNTMRWRMTSFAVPAFEQGLLASGEPAAQRADDEVVAHVGLGPLLSSRPRRNRVPSLEEDLMAALAAAEPATAARERMIERYLPLADSLMRRYRHTTEPLDDLARVRAALARRARPHG